MTTAESRTFPFSEPDRLDPEPLYAELRRQEPLSRVQLPYGEPAWLATRHDDVRVSTRAPERMAITWDEAAPRSSRQAG